MKRKGVKTRVAYGTDKDGKVFNLGDTVAAALKVNMLVKDFERDLIRANPALKIAFKIERI